MSENLCKLEKRGNMLWIICGKQISVPDSVQYQQCKNITCGYTTQILNQYYNSGKIALYIDYVSRLPEVVLVQNLKMYTIKKEERQTSWKRKFNPRNQWSKVLEWDWYYTPS